jgi:transcriptional regulator with XRE-family HTH domain
MYDTLATTIGDQTRATRLAAGVPLHAVAQALGLPVLVLARLERGKLMPSIVTLVELCAFFGVTPGTLLNRPPTEA